MSLLDSSFCRSLSCASNKFKFTSASPIVSYQSRYCSSCALVGHGSSLIYSSDDRILYSSSFSLSPIYLPHKHSSQMIISFMNSSSLIHLTPRLFPSHSQFLSPDHHHSNSSLALHKKLTPILEASSCGICGE